MKSKKVDAAKLARMASHDAARMKQMGEATGSRNSPHLIDYQGAKRSRLTPRHRLMKRFQSTF
jgi:hypothetical protein